MAFLLENGLYCIKRYQDVCKQKKHCNDVMT